MSSTNSLTRSLTMCELKKIFCYFSTGREQKKVDKVFYTYFFIPSLCVSILIFNAAERERGFMCVFIRMYRLGFTWLFCYSFWQRDGKFYIHIETEIFITF